MRPKKLWWPKRKYRFGVRVMAGQSYAEDNKTGNSKIANISLHYKCYLAEMTGKALLTLLWIGTSFYSAERSRCAAVHLASHNPPVQKLDRFSHLACF